MPTSDPAAAAAQAAKADGMNRVDAHADPIWKDEMFAYVVAVASTYQFFTSDDVFDAAETGGLAHQTHDLRAFGPVMARAARADICFPANVAPVSSRRRSLHASPRRVWQSNLFLK